MKQERNINTVCTALCQFSIAANLSDAQVQNARFSSNSPGMTEELKQDLIKRGAIFDGG
ncbi:hypothetical protein VB834_01715 [Limnoraphis robusta Tam1]|uniref:Uncharacterized protein n=1 Tax=Limnoraphis robusta CCNP1315 TaxID=3110306 RepID=A0ABU5TVZ5_9CYAN|nr:hypothetical protein [Limnoraphis robusta]MEA5496953.1 hypothetical protein [Limnoraphis robusta BA-68 BA1]MEA5519077.1 hypothetical protein [Limnoraphis robusta CCNP1315]MEA5537744.1 hypothetical protein [Limnoraphis robusta Tam1]MEA5547470.1 hypothetical protein [Limnoraphis robusta CCNP1324]